MRERQRRYEASPKGRASARERAHRYRGTTKGILARARWLKEERGSRGTQD